MIVICTIYCVFAGIEAAMDVRWHTEHLIFEALGLIVLCLIYFSTIVDLIRKLRIFVLEETKLEANLVRVQFAIFFVAYGSKVITLLYWVKNPPHERKYIEGFLINTDVMSLIWIMVPITFVLWMQMRSFAKMKQEKIELLLGADKLDCPDDPTLNLNKSGW